MTGFNWVLDQKKFLSKEEVTRLLRTAEQKAREASTRNHKVAVRDYFIIHLALSTGLRVMEIAQLNCGDIFLGGDASSLLVRKGKGGKKRLVYFNGSFKHHYNEYTLWKQSVGEPVGPEDPLILSSNTKSYMTTRAIEKAFKRTAIKAGLPSYYSIHCLRHTYACHLYKASGYNLRLVQKQLGHSSSKITEVYADVMNPDLSRSLEKLFT
ncbi:MAG: tyrosine-type recombinase/integrase [Sedimentisphaerales bacterium]|jgi:site-specific recombinase XerD